MELRIREFRKEDMDAVYFLDLNCYPPAQRSSYGSLLDTLLDRDVVALVAEEAGEEYDRVVGALIVQGDPWRSRLYIVSLMVNEEFRRLGIARRLLGWANRLALDSKTEALLVRLPEDEEEGESGCTVFLAANGFDRFEEEPGMARRPGMAQQTGEPAEGQLWRREVSDEQGE